MIATPVTLLEASHVARAMNAHVVEVSDEPPVMTDVQLDSAISGLTHAVGLFGPNNSVTVAFDSRVIDLSLADAEVFSREVNSVMTVARYLNSVRPSDRLAAARALDARSTPPSVNTDRDELHRALHTFARQLMCDAYIHGQGMTSSFDPELVKQALSIIEGFAGPEPEPQEIQEAYRVLDENASDEFKAKLAAYVARHGSYETYCDDRRFDPEGVAV